MAIYENLSTFAGKRVENWQPGDPLPDFATVAPRLMVDEAWDKEGGAAVLMVPIIDAFVDEGGGAADALVIGAWGQCYENNSAPIVQSLAGHAPALSALRSLFLGDLTMEEAEISWIEQSDVTEILTAFPHLEELGVRGGTNLGLSPVEHTGLRKLVIETGGMPGAVVRAIAASTFPALRHLELWLGDEGYGNDTTIGDLRPILDGKFELSTLGLRNVEGQDALAAAIVDAPVLDKVEVLDLSLGDLTDVGAEALLASAKVLQVRHLDLHHHYLSPNMAERLLALPIEVNVSDPQEADVDGDDVYRPIFASE